ncbi:MAG TPA: LysR family transcriptional regulator [Streptosporangiaceae bacterium]|jgi:DNA-binding transcriptional LysR family regulator|nr:LysR family transcriptional regulator [Streptosporangiaceae bacterium]
MLDVTRLRVLVAVARHGSVTAAARALNYAQPSVSHHLARLEAETGAMLTQRSGRGIKLTDAGWLLAGRAEEILGRLDSAERELAAHVEHRAERIRLAGFCSALATIVPAAVSQLTAGQPDADPLLVEAEPAEAVQLLRAGQVDVALVVRHLQDGTPVGPAVDASGTRSRLILDEPVHLVTRPPGPPRPPGTPDAGGQVRRPGLAAHADSPWIAGCEHCRGHLIWLCEQAGFTPKISVTTDDHVAAQAMVAAGLGITILPGLALDAARHPGVEAQPLPGARREVLAVTYGPAPDECAVDRLLDLLTLAGQVRSRRPALASTPRAGGA